MNDKTSDKRYRITLTENQLALVGTAVEGMMNDLISRKALCEYALNQKDKSVTPNDIMRFPPAQPEQLTDKEQRIFLAAMGREEKVCKQVDEECCREPYEDSLVRVCHEIIRKVKATLWET